MPRAERRTVVPVPIALLFALIALATTADGQGPGVAPAFVENRGQLDATVRFTSGHGGVGVVCTEDGFLFCLSRRSERSSPVGDFCPADLPTALVPPALERELLALTIEGASADAIVEGLEELPGRHASFRGRDMSRWVSDARRFGRVRLRGVLAGVDVEAYWSGGVLEYDVVLHPGADASDVVLRYEGARGLRAGPDGSLVMETGLGELRQSAPRVLALRNDRWTPVEARVRPLDSGRFRFEIPGGEPYEELRIDPTLVWSTFLGGAGEDQAAAVTVDAAGCPIVTGFTASPSFPDTVGIPSPGGDWDVFVTRLSRDGSTVLYSAVFGGSFGVDPGTGQMLPGNEVGVDVVVDAAGRITVLGWTGSEDFPTTTGCFDPSYNGGIEARELGDSFLVRLDPGQAGAAQLAYSTFLGGSKIDNAFALASDGSGEVTIAGHTHSPGFPTTPGAFQTAINDPVPGDAFVCRLAPGGNGAADLLWSTFLGGSGFDYAYGMVLDGSGRPVVVGQAGATPDFPVTPGAFDETHNGFNEGFVAHLDPAAAGNAQLLYSSYLGGSGNDTIQDMDLHPSGDAVLAGHTSSADLPVKPDPGALDTSYNGGLSDVFLARFSPGGGGAADLVWCTYLGGAGRELSQRVRVGPGGAVNVCGFTGSSDFPVTPGARQLTHGGGAEDAFLARLSATGTELLHSSYVGGNADDFGYGLAVDSLWNATLVGTTASADFPATPGVLGSAYGGGASDGYVARICPVDCSRSASLSLQGRATPGVAGVPRLGTTGDPVLGNAGFAVELSSAAPNAGGLWLVRSFVDAPSGSLVRSGRRGWFQPVAIPLSTDASGRATLTWPLECRARSCGAVVQVRAVVQDAAASGGTASTRLLTIQVGS